MVQRITIPRSFVCLTVCLLCVNGCADKESAQATAQEKLMWQQVSEQGAFEVTLDPQDSDAVAINQFQEWVLTVKNPDGKPVALSLIHI